MSLTWSCSRARSRSIGNVICRDTAPESLTEFRRKTAYGDSDHVVDAEDAREDETEKERHVGAV
jgi:hypothetical protein